MKRLFFLIAIVLPVLAIGQDWNIFSRKKPKKPKSSWTNATPVKNALAFKISVPEGNYLRLNKGQSYGNAWGFLGISAGLEYYFSKKNNINIDIGTLTDFLVPFPAAVDYLGPYERSFANYADIQLGTDLRRFHLDAGVQMHKSEYYKRETVNLYPVYVDTLKYYTIQHNLGFALSGYYRFTRTFNIGINYYPSFFAWHNQKFDTHYGHLLFLELIFRIKAYTPKKSLSKN